MRNIILFLSLLTMLIYGAQLAMAESNAIPLKQPKKVKPLLQGDGKVNEVECDADAHRETCRNEELIREDTKLNLAYQKLMKAIAEPAKQTKLRETERQWLQFVEKNCQFEASTYGDGSLGPVTYTECRIRHTKARTAELADQFSVCSSYYAC